jgi:hypothetical protein
MSLLLRLRTFALVTIVFGSMGAVAQPVQLKVFDKAGNEVGPFDHGLVYIRLDESTLVAVRLGYLTVESPRGTWSDVTRMVPVSGPSTISFTERDCMGAAYMSYLTPDVPGVMPMGAVVSKSGRATLYIGKARRPVYRSLQSLFYKYGAGCRNRMSQDYVVPVTSTFDLTARFPAPYTLR